MFFSNIFDRFLKNDFFEEKNSEIIEILIKRLTFKAKKYFIGNFF